MTTRHGMVSPVSLSRVMSRIRTRVSVGFTAEGEEMFVFAFDSFNVNAGRLSEEALGLSVPAGTAARSARKRKILKPFFRKKAVRLSLPYEIIEFSPEKKTCGVG